MGGPIENWLTGILTDLAKDCPALEPLKIKSEREVGSAHFFSTLSVQLIVSVLVGVFHVKLLVLLTLPVGFLMVILPELKNGRKVDRITRGAGWVAGLIPIVLMAVFA
jgi:hypothetical protein